MARKYELRPETVKQINELRNALDDETQRHRNAWQRRAAAWRDGDDGTAVDGWLADLDELIETLENVAESVEVTS